MLSNLISKMTGAEKRYFSIRSKSFKQDAQHFRLYKQIEKYGEDSILKQMDSSFKGNSAALKKRYLKEMLMDSLRNFNKNKTVGRVIMNHIQDAETFYHKLLFKECLKSLKKARKLAVMHERFGLHLEIINWERRLIGSTMENYDITEADLDNEEESIHEKNNEELWARKMQAKVFEFKKAFGFLDKTQVKMLESAIPKKTVELKRQLKSKRAEFYYIWMKAIYYSIRSEHEKCYDLTAQIKNHFSSAVDPEDLYFGMLEHLTSCIYTHRYDEVISRLQKLNDLKKSDHFKNNIAIEERYFYYYANYSMIANASMGNVEKTREIIALIKKEIPTKKDPISPQMIRVLTGSNAQVEFALGNYKEAKIHCVELLSYPKSVVRIDVIDSMKLLYLFILFELQQFDLLESEARASYNYFLKNKVVFKYQLNIARAFMKNNSDTNKLGIAKLVLEQLERRMNTNSPNEFFEDLIFVMWAKSVIHGEGKSMLEFKKWHEKKLS